MENERERQRGVENERERQRGVENERERQRAVENERDRQRGVENERERQRGVENDRERQRGVEVVGRDGRARAVMGDKKKKHKLMTSIKASLASIHRERTRTTRHRARDGTVIDNQDLSRPTETNDDETELSLQV